MKTKRHKFRFSFFLALILLMCYALVLVAVSSFIESYNKPEGANYLLLVVGLILFIYSIDILIKFLKYFPIIEIDDKTIKIKKHTYLLKDIEEIKLTGKVPIKFMVDQMIEGIYIQFINGETLYIYEEYYSNIGHIKTYLTKTLDLKEINNYSEKKDIKSNDSNMDNNFIKIYKGGYRKVALVFILPSLIFLGFIVVGFIKEDKNMAGFTLSLLVIYIIFMCLICYNWMFYFSIYNDKLIVRNFYFRWIKKTYEISDLKEVVIERIRFSVGLRLIMKNYNTVIHPGMTLKNVNWIELQNEFESRGIIVRNECFSVD